MQIKYIVVHCSDTEAGKDFHASDIDRWHRERGFRCIGYHFVISLNGVVETGRLMDTQGAHVQHYNHCSLGICYIGGRQNGKNADTRTAAQTASLLRLLTELLRRFPQAKVCGHRDLNPHKACPCFDVAEWARAEGIPKAQIYDVAEYAGLCDRRRSDQPGSSVVDAPQPGAKSKGGSQ